MRSGPLEPRSSPPPLFRFDAQRVREGFGNRATFCRVLQAVALQIGVLRLEHGRLVGIAEPNRNAVVMRGRNEQGFVQRLVAA